MIDRIQKVFNVAGKSIRYLFSGSVKFRYKIIPILGLAYWIYPSDFIFDLFPFVGQFDDFSVILAFFTFFVFAVENHYFDNKRS